MKDSADRPTVDELRQWLRGPLADALSDRYGKLDISFLSQATTVADGTTVLLLRDSVARSRAVVLCSASVAPDMVERAMHRARQAKAILGASIGAPILDSLAEGRVRGLSYAVLPFCNELSDFWPLRWMQRALLRPVIFDWLWRVTECTLREPDPDAANLCFAEPLRHMTSLAALSDRVRAAATRAAESLESGTWTPRQVLMHGDLWSGNILIRTANGAAKPRKWRDRFVIIDWAGSEIHGYAIYDLVRLARSLRLKPRGLRNEVERHCRLLDCKQTVAPHYLLAALAHISMNLEHFPIEQYALMCDSCLATLERALEQPQG